MTHSMTAYATHKVEHEAGTILWELRSVNHRYLEVHIRLPEQFNALEPQVREKIRQVLNRGKIDCWLKFQPKYQQNHFTLNHTLLEQLAALLQKIDQVTGHTAPANNIELLRWPGVLQIPETDLNHLEKPLLDALLLTLHDMQQARAREGHKLIDTLLPRLNALKEELQKVKQLLPQLIPKQRERLEKKFAEAKMALEPQRLEQEIVVFAHKIDIAEELDRLQVHIKEVERLVTATGTHGRRLDFLMQELTREANTLGSKTNDTEIIHASVEMKVIIEQMREQIQNIE